MLAAQPQAQAQAMEKEPELPARSPEPTVLAAEKPACAPFSTAATRRGGDLTIEVDSVEGTQPHGRRLRSQSRGALSSGSKRVWFGPPVPEQVPLTEGTTELFLLDHIDEGFFGFYRDPYGASSCTLGSSANCQFHAKGFGLCGKPTWTADLSRHLPRKTHLEIQDIRSAFGILYYNEACQSYSKEAKGKCSYLVAFDPKSETVLWRTRPLISNSHILVEKDFIVTGYGFTRERDFLFVVRRADGKILDKLRLKSAPNEIERIDGDHLRVITGKGTLTVDTLNWDSDKPLLQIQPPGSTIVR